MRSGVVARGRCPVVEVARRAATLRPEAGWSGEQSREEGRPIPARVAPACLTPARLVASGVVASGVVAVGVVAAEVVDGAAWPGPRGRTSGGGATTASTVVSLARANVRVSATEFAASTRRSSADDTTAGESVPMRTVSRGEEDVHGGPVRRRLRGWPPGQTPCMGMEGLQGARHRACIPRGRR